MSPKPEMEFVQPDIEGMRTFVESSVKAMRLTKNQREALGFMASRPRGVVWNGEYVHLTIVRNLAALGLVELNEWRGRWDTAKKVSKWNASITELGRLALLRHTSTPSSPPKRTSETDPVAVAVEPSCSYCGSTEGTHRHAHDRGWPECINCGAV